MYSRLFNNTATVALHATVAAAASAMLASAAHAEEARRSFDVKAQPLGAAIIEFSRQSDAVVTAPAELTRNKRSSALQGSMTTEEALAQLLRGTALSARSTGGRTYTLAPAASERTLPDTGARAIGPFPAAPAGLEEVVVTAQKRGKEQLLHVPVPVTALDAQKLAINGKTSIVDYYSSIPGLNVSPDSQGRQYFTIRGVNSGRNSIPTVGMTLDDIPIGASIGGPGTVIDLDPNDISAVEVLRGPQGTLYGANSMGGLINYRTLDPHPDRMSGRVQLGTNFINGGSDPGYKAYAALNLPLGDTLSVRLSGYSRQDPGYIDDPSRKLTDLNTERTNGGLLKLVWRPTAALSVTAGALYQDKHGDGFTEVDKLQGLSDLQQQRAPVNEYVDRRIGVYFTNIGLDLGKVKFSSTSAFQRTRYADALDLSPNAFWSAAAMKYFSAPYAVTPERFDFKKFSEEFRTTVDFTPRISGMVGIFYADEKSKNNQVFGAYDQNGNFKGAIQRTENIASTYNEKALFGDVIIRPTEKFNIQVGVRQSWIETGDAGGLYTGALYPTPELNDSNVVQLRKTTYLVAPSYTFSRNLMAYGRVSTGYRPGGPNDLAPGIPPGYGSDNITNYEIGLKADIAQKLTIDTSIYYIDWKDLQLVVSRPVGGFKLNGGGAKSQGFELSLGWAPQPGLNVTGWLNYDDAGLTEQFPYGSPLSGRKGDVLPFSSRYSGHVSVEKTFSIGDGEANIAASADYVGKRISNFLAPNLPRQVFPSYVRIDLQAGYRWESWTANIYLNNVFDERGIINQDNFQTFRYTYISPRALGILFTRDF